MMHTVGEMLRSCDAEERKKVLFIFSVLTPASEFYLLLQNKNAQSSESSAVPSWEFSV